MWAPGEVELVELLGDHGDPRRALHQARVVQRVDEVVGAELVETIRGQSPEPLVGQPQRGGEQVLLVVLEVHHVGSAEGRDGALGCLANHLARRPGADHGLVRVASPVPEPAVEPLVVDALEARLADGRDPVRVALAAEDDLDALRRHLLAEVERLDDAVDVELPEVEEEDPHPTASRIATACGSPLNGDSGVVGRLPEEAPAVVRVARLEGLVGQRSTKSARSITSKSERRCASVVWHDGSRGRRADDAEAQLPDP